MHIYIYLRHKAVTFIYIVNLFNEHFVLPLYIMSFYYRILKLFLKVIKYELRVITVPIL